MSLNNYTPVDFDHVTDVALTTRDHSGSSGSSTEQHDRQETIDAYPDKFEAFSSTYDGLISAIRISSPDSAQNALNLFDTELRDRSEAARHLDDETIIRAGAGHPENHLRRIKRCIERVFEAINENRSVNSTDPVQLAWHLHIPTTEENIPEFEPNKAYAYLRDLDSTYAPTHSGEYGNTLENEVQDQLSQLGYPLRERWFEFSSTDPTDSGNRELDINTNFSGEDVILEIFTGSDHLKDRQVRDYTRLHAKANDEETRPHAIHVTDTKSTRIPVEVLQLLLDERPDQRPIQVSQRNPLPSLTASLDTDGADERDELADIADLFNDAGIRPKWALLNGVHDETTASYPIVSVEFDDTTVYLGFRNDPEQSAGTPSEFLLESGEKFYWVTITRPTYEQGHTITTLHPEVLLALLYLGTPFEPLGLGAIQSRRDELIGRNMAYETEAGNLTEAEVLDIYSEGRTKLWIELNISGLGKRVDASGDAVEQCTGLNNWADSGRYTQLYLRNPHTHS